MTAITQEGLDTVRSELRRVATRQMAVACYVQRGTGPGARGPRLAWTVGSKRAFAADGSVAVARTSLARAHDERKDASTAGSLQTPGLRMACLLATASGLSHDFGKFGRMFQDKLRGDGPMKDAIRHEWLSLHLLLTPGALDTEEGWYAAWERASTNLPRLGDITHRRNGRVDFKDGLRSAAATIEYLVCTHHRMPRDPDGKVSMCILSEQTYLDPDQKTPDLRAAGAPQPDTLALRRTTLARIAAAVEQLDSRRDDPVFWRALATLSRMGLILADHYVSSQNLTGDLAHGAALQAAVPGAVFANTAPTASGQNGLNQQLDWHLRNVGLQAPQMLSRMLQFDPPGLSPETLDRIRQPATGRFEWQTRCATALQVAQANEPLPTLVLNIAGTGCGKTRMNVLAIAALRQGQPGDETVRIATGLNLRTLTLQTRDAYARQLGMGPTELSCVIGCSLAVQMHDARLDGQDAGRGTSPPGGEVEDEDGNPIEEEFEADGFAEAPPAWLAHFLDRNPNLASVVMSPVVVCTADFLVRAGDPTEKANQALTMVRLMNSDLVLDEIDSYDPKALVAVMRLVAAAAMFGRHVVASSATLSVPVAKALYDAYELGVNMGERAGLCTTARWRQAVIDDKSGAHLQVATSEPEFEDWFRRTLLEILDGMGQLSYRPAELARVVLQGDRQGRREGVQSAIAQGVQRMHERHRWAVTHQGAEHHISLGLVRVANIRNAVLVAKRLAALAGTRVCCYHSQLSRMHRYLLERNLDQILTRHPSVDRDPGALVLENQEVRAAVERSQAAGERQTMFIVVATPVEEIGRDHDFDWALIEPSSTQAIVQPAGRVNRHRLAPTASPNVGVLQFNFLEADQNPRDQLVFQRPGLEALIDERSSHPSHDLAETLDWNRLLEHGQIDARLRYLTEVHDFARYDDNACALQIRQHAARFLNSASPLWMGATTYDDVPLREKTSPMHETWTKNVLGEHLRQEPSPRQPKRRMLCKRDSIVRERAPASAWLAWSTEQLLAHASNMGLTCEEAMQVEVRPVRESEKDRFAVTENEAFGYYKAGRT